MTLGNHLETKITTDEGDVFIVPTDRDLGPPPESDTSFWNKHGRHIFAVMHGYDLVMLTGSVSTTREPEQSDTDFVASHIAACQAA